MRHRARRHVIADGQWNIHTPARSGTMSAVTICAGAMETTSVVSPPVVTTLPCQWGVWKLNPSPMVTRYQRTCWPRFMVIMGMSP